MPDDDSVQHNGDPQEVAGPDGSEVKAGDAELDKADTIAPPAESQFGLRDELAEQFPMEQIVLGISPDDGMPLPMDSAEHLPTAPKFGPDTLVCLEDEREFVEVLGSDDLVGARFSREVERALYSREYDEYELRRKRKDSTYSSAAKASGFVPVRDEYDADGNPTERRRFSPSQVIRKWGASFVATAEGLLLVRPRRERCEHYKRMVFANDDTAYKPGEFGHQVVYRNCAARRSVGGAQMSVQDQAVYACEHRCPRDPASVSKFLDEPDRKRIAANVEMVPLFNLKEK